MKLLNWFFKRTNTVQEGIELDYHRLPKKSKANHGLLPIVNHAKKAGYVISKINYPNGMIRFCRKGDCINFYTTTRTISTEIDHPKKGKTQLHRKGLSMTELRSVFDNPRTHTGKGYYKK